MLEPSCISRIPDNLPWKYTKSLNKEKFSTFFGFCQNHDDNLFKRLDTFDGIIDSEKATLVHYRNICYGIYHIKISLKKVQHLSRQNYAGPSTSESENCLENLKNGYFEARLNDCLKQHNLRKKILEDMINAKDFKSINFFSIGLGLEQPIFSGRSHYILHPEHEFFSEGGYPYLSLISYMTLRTENRNELLFVWLERDKNHAEYLKNIIGEEKKFKTLIGTLAYACSDALAMNKDFYTQNSDIFNEAFKNLRTY